MSAERDAEATDFVFRMLSLPFVDEGLCREFLGAGPRDISAARLYLQTPVRARPVLSHFFDRHYYIETNPDVMAAGVDPFIHFLRYGCGEGRSPHPLINFEYMRGQDRFLFSDSPSIQQLHEALAFDLVDPSPYFSIEHYRGFAPRAEELQCGLLGHFLSEGLNAGLRPNALLDPNWYYRQLDGTHDVRSGLRHFVTVGDRQGLASRMNFSGALYLERNPDVAAAGIPPLLHYLRTGRDEGRACFHVPLASGSVAPQPLAGDGPGDLTGETDLVSTYQLLKDRIALRRQELKNAVTVSPPEVLDFADPLKELSSLLLPHFEMPRVSILIPAYNQAKYTAECIASIVKSNPTVTYEVVIADDASPDVSAQALKRIRNVKFVQQSTNIGFLRNCNSTVRHCIGQYLLLLNNDAQLTLGALDALVAILDGNPDVAAVGPKILYPNGRLQEAGCTVDRDGISGMVGLFLDPSTPAYNYDREVQYCSGAALLIRSSEIQEGLFDESFAPAYCEDADLCLRLLSRGRKIIYCSKAEVIHHLSISTNKQSVDTRLQLVSRNQQKLSQKWSSLLDEVNTVRPIAFYLPQYYPTPENDFYWGQGFTEWSNVAKAVPAYVGHYQPHLPADLGFYDLRVKQNMQRQALLAKRYGIAGFCVYYYNFGRQRALEQAFEAMVADASIDFPYCVCWANENWTRHWDGGDRELIFEQMYENKILLAVIDDAVRYAADPRYLRVNGRPLLLVYRPLLIPDPQKFAALSRHQFRKAGFEDVYLAYVESMETAQKGRHPAELGFDACVEFPPQGLAVRAAKTTDSVLREGFVGVRYDYEATVSDSVTRPSVNYKRHPSVFPSWDNTPRQPLKGDSFINATPEAFQVYIEEKLDDAIRLFIGDERLLFINAWNEWAEGTHLEPDQRFGHRWLEAVRNAMLAKSLA
jgi:O-antigen biosynthesis protein